MTQIKEKPASPLAAVMNSRAWKLGMADYTAGLPLPLGVHTHLKAHGIQPSRGITMTSQEWNYERGRHFAAETGLGKLARGARSVVCRSHEVLAQRAVENKVVI